MVTVLGIHAGHEASCAVVRDGKLVAALQQERVTGRKYDGQETLSKKLPINEVMQIAEISLADCDYIISSFQAAGPGAVGLQRPIISEDFFQFDPFDKRHWVVSHHLAHAASAAFTSGFEDCAVLVSDSAGSTTLDGKDYVESFSDFYKKYSSNISQGNLYTEKRSIYHFSKGNLIPIKKDYLIPHNQPDVFVQSESSLYDNFSRFVFQKEHCHGQLMALSNLEDYEDCVVNSDLSKIDIISKDGLSFNTNWQHKIKNYTEPHLSRYDAGIIQSAFTDSIIAQSKKALSITNTRKICCAGGVFLNLASNTAISNLVGENNFYVPSSPHDAGISIGCAFIGSSWDQKGFNFHQVRSDFLGRKPTLDLNISAFTDTVIDNDVPREISNLLLQGEIVIRFSGREEFGPRALGNRSLLALASINRNKDSLNIIKQRQFWRPVSPMIMRNDFSEYFSGPTYSDFMGREHIVKPKWQDTLSAITHGADNTARVQILTDDPAISEIKEVMSFLKKSGTPPIIMNTSLNGPGQPIINKWSDLVSFALKNNLKYIWSGGKLFTLKTTNRNFRLKEGVYFILLPQNKKSAMIVHGAKTAPIERGLYDRLVSQENISADSLKTSDLNVLINLDCIEHISI